MFLISLVIQKDQNLIVIKLISAKTKCHCVFFNLGEIEDPV